MFDVFQPFSPVRTSGNWFNGEGISRKEKWSWPSLIGVQTQFTLRLGYRADPIR